MHEPGPTIATPAPPLAIPKITAITAITAREVTLFAVLLALGELFFFHRVLVSGLHQMVGDYVNHLLANFICEHEYRWLLRRPDHAALWDPPVYYPLRGALVFAETLLGVAPIFCVWRLLGLAPDTAYQAFMMTLPALNFAAAYLLFRRGFRCAAVPALAGSFLCAFANILGAQVNNPQLQTVFYTYLALYFLCLIWRGGRRTMETAAVAGLTAALVMQLYACFYLGWLALFLLGCTALCMLPSGTLRPRLLAALRDNWPALAAAAALAALALAPLVLRALATVRALHWANDSTATLPHLSSWFYMGRRSLAYFWFSRSGLFDGIDGEPEQRLGLGLVTAACAAVGYWWQRDNRWYRLAFAVGALLVVLSTDLPNGASLWYAVRAVVPGARALRYMSRDGVLVLLPAAVGISAFAAGCRRRGMARRLAVLLALCAAEQIYSEYTFSKDAARVRIAHYATAISAVAGVGGIDRRCKSVYVAVDETPAAPAGAAAAAAPSWVVEVELMMAELRTGVPEVNGGYTRFAPAGYGSLAQNVVRGQADVPRLRGDLAAWQRRQGLQAADVCWLEVASPPRQPAPAR